MSLYRDPERINRIAADCQARIRSTPPWCTHKQTWEVEVFSPGTDEWKWLRVCDPCMEDFHTRQFEIRAERQLSHASSVRAVWEPLVGRKVIFTYFHGERQEGVVTSCNDKYVFVRFGAHTTSESCDPSMLTLVGVAGRQ